MHTAYRGLSKITRQTDKGHWRELYNPIMSLSVRTWGQRCLQDTQSIVQWQLLWVHGQRNSATWCEVDRTRSGESNLELHCDILRRRRPWSSYGRTSNIVGQQRQHHIGCETGACWNEAACRCLISDIMSASKYLRNNLQVLSVSNAIAGVS